MLRDQASGAVKFMLCWGCHVINADFFFHCKEFKLKKTLSLSWYHYFFFFAGQHYPVPLHQGGVLPSIDISPRWHPKQVDGAASSVVAAGVAVWAAVAQGAGVTQYLLGSRLDRQAALFVLSIMYFCQNVLIVDCIFYSWIRTVSE